MAPIPQSVVAPTVAAIYAAYERDADTQNRPHLGASLVGLRFGNLVVIELAYKKRSGTGYLCKCDCGTEKIVLGGNLKAGRTKSCGCLTYAKVSEKLTRHGHATTSKKSASPTYSSWSSMLTRCYNENNKSYIRYGGRGITVCDRWHNFESFLDDMGEKPKKGMSIERVNNDGNYEPGNCVWATATEQNRNTRKTLLNKPLADAIRNSEVSVSDAVEITGCTIRAAKAAKYGSNWTA